MVKFDDNWSQSYWFDLNFLCFKLNLIAWWNIKLKKNNKKLFV